MLGTSAPYLIKTVINWTAITYVIHHHFADKSSVIFYSTDSDLIMPTLLTTFTSAWSTIILFNDQPQQYPMIPSPDAYKRELITFLAGQQFTSNLKNWRTNPTWNQRGRTIILPSESNITEDTVKILFSAAWKVARVSNAIVLTLDGKAYAWSPHSPDECNEIRTIKLLPLEDLFKTTGSMYGCPLKVSTSIVSPYVSGANGNYTGGLEVDIVKALATHYNMSVSYISHNISLGTGHWVLRNKDGSLGGALEYLDRYEADIAFSSFSLSAFRFYKGEALFPHTQDEILWFLKSPKEKRVVFHFFNTFDLQAWLLALCFYISVALCFYFGERKFSIDDALLRAYSIFLQCPVEGEFNDRTNALTILTYIFAIHLLIAYQTTLLVNLVVTHSEKQVQSLEDGLARGMNFTILPSLIFQYEATEPAWSSLFQSKRYVMEGNTLENLRRIANHSDPGLMSLNPKNPAIYYMNYEIKIKRRDLKIDYLPERFMPLPVCMYMYVGHPMWPQFQNSLIHLLEGGLQHYWLHWYLNESNTPQKSTKNHLSISVRHISGIIPIYIFSIILSLICFIVEIISFEMRGVMVLSRSK